MQRIKEAKVMFNNKKQPLCSNNFSLEMKKKRIKRCVWSVAVYGSETWTLGKRTLGKNEEREINAFETLCWRRMLKIKWTERIRNDEVFFKGEWWSFSKGERGKITFEKFKNRRHSWIRHTIRHNEFVANILEGATSGEKAVERPRLQYLKQVASNRAADSFIH